MEQNTLLIYISMLLTMHRHSLVPSNLSLPTIIPIPKSALSSYDSYRGALLGVIDTVLDHIPVVVKMKIIMLNLSNLQLGFQKDYSTVQSYIVR